MHVLFEIYHPAQVHLFKGLISYLRTNGHVVTVVTKDKDLTNRLLDGLGIPYRCLSGMSGGLVQLGSELALRDWRLFRLHQELDFQIAFGSSVSICHLSALTGVPSVNFCEDDDAIVKLYARIAYPFATHIVHPQGLRAEGFAEKRIFHPSYQKLAYLHPNTFEPSESIVRSYGLEPGTYSILRRSAYTAFHDQGQGGFNDALLTEVLSRLDSGPIVKSVENAKSHEIDPSDMHHLLGHARLVVCDSQSMAVEAAVLGVPSVRISSFAGQLSILNEIEDRYRLSYGFRPDQGNAFLACLDCLLAEPNLAALWRERRYQMLGDKIDLNAWMIELFERMRMRYGGSGC
jgi:uncharacterized protein